MEYTGIEEVISLIENKGRHRYLAFDDVKMAVEKLRQEQKIMVKLQEENESFGNVLAVIHRDGGHYVTKYGHKQASEDAVKIVIDLRTRLEEKEKIIKELMRSFATIGLFAEAPKYGVADALNNLRKISEVAEQVLQGTGNQQGEDEQEENERLKKIEQEVIDKSVKAAVAVIMGSVVEAIGVDGHSWSDRPCQTCRVVSGIIGRPFGCYWYQEKKGKSNVEL